MSGAAPVFSVDGIEADRRHSRKRRIFIEFIRQKIQLMPLDFLLLLRPRRPKRRAFLCLCKILIFIHPPIRQEKDAHYRCRYQYKHIDDYKQIPLKRKAEDDDRKKGEKQAPPDFRGIYMLAVIMVTMAASRKLKILRRLFLPDAPAFLPIIDGLSAPWTSLHLRLVPPSPILYCHRKHIGYSFILSAVFFFVNTRFSFAV